MPKSISCNGKLSPEPRSGKAGLVDFSVTVKERLDILPVYLHLADLPQWKAPSHSSPKVRLLSSNQEALWTHTPLYSCFFLSR